MHGTVFWTVDGDVFVLMVKVSCVSMSPSGVLTENVHMSMCRLGLGTWR